MNTEKVAYIHNYLQAMLYIKNGCNPVRCEYDETRDKIVFVFDKKDSYQYYVKWRNRELK